VGKSELGTKRICPSCGARYYDLHRDPIICPKCGTEFDPEALLKTRRARPAPVLEAVVDTPLPVEEVEADLEVEEVSEEEVDGAIVKEAEEEEEEVIEDASELGEDEDDMNEVIENVEDEEDP